MKTLGLMVTILALSAASAHAEVETPSWGVAAPVTHWWPVVWTITGRGPVMLWLHESDLPRGIAMDGRQGMPLYSLTCSAGRCTSALSTRYTLTKLGSLFSNGGYEINIHDDGGSVPTGRVQAILGAVDGRPGDLAARRAALTPDANGRVTVLSPEASAEAIAAAQPPAATSDAVTEEDAAAIAASLTDTDTTFGEPGTLDAADASGAEGDATTDIDAEDAVAVPDDSIEGAAASSDDATPSDAVTTPGPATDLQTPAPPAPERTTVTRRGLAMPDRVAAGAGLGLLGMIAAVMMSATPLGIAAAALTMGGAGFGLASFFGSHEE
jgi:hypothetical protein